VWLLTYTFGKKVFQVLINGYTGAIAGRRPYSWIKITLAVLAAAAAIGIIVLLANQLDPPPEAVPRIALPQAGLAGDGAGGIPTRRSPNR